MRVLLVEDDLKLGRILSQVIQSAGIETDWAKDGDEAFDFVAYSAGNIYDVIILDWMLPGKTGPEICRILREDPQYNYTGGVMFLTARDALEDRVTGLEVGGDDYLVKPFENAELIARLHALNRRKAKPYIDDVAKIAGVVLNRNEHTVVYGDITINFSSREFEIFDLLLINLDKVLPRNTIIEHIWGMESDVTSASLDSYIYLLRKKIKPLERVLSIKLLRGVGYKIEQAHDTQD